MKAKEKRRQIINLVDLCLAKHWEPLDHSLDRLGWRFFWTTRKTQFGVCNYHKKKIGVSKVLVNRCSLEKLKDTVLHEIAHAIAWERWGRAGTGHGRRWKECCRITGADPNRTKGYDFTDAQKREHYKYRVYCESCDFEIWRHRMTRRTRRSTCPKCCRMYNPDYRLTVEEI